MTSHAPAQCCTTGKLHEGVPSGQQVKINGAVDGYLARAIDAPSRKHIAVLYLPDILGIWQNSKLTADAFAAAGFTCLVPDLFNGDPAPFNMPANFDIMGWLTNGTDGKNPHTPEAIDSIVLSGIKYLKELGFTSIAGAGYCFGAKYVVRHYENGIDCGFIAHPSFVEADELARITGPLSIAAAETDDIFPAEKRHESEGILQGTKQAYQINLFSGVEHGFAVRGDPTDPRQRFAKEQAFFQAVSWFAEHLGKR